MFEPGVVYRRVVLLNTKLHIFFFVQVYKWVPAIATLVCYLRLLTSIPSGKEREGGGGGW